MKEVRPVIFDALVEELGDPNDAPLPDKRTHAKAKRARQDANRLTAEVCRKIGMETK